MCTLNEDGISVKGCSYIYAPRGQAGEYSSLATNPYRGCGHGCKYCYVPLAIKINRAEFNKGATPRPGYLQKLEADAKKYRELRIKEQVMLSFTTDPYPPQHHIDTRKAIQILKWYGMGFCTLTKGGSRALRDIDLFRPERDAFASTLTSLDESFQKEWEPFAASPQDRMDTLKTFHDRGIFTWVSLEPTISAEASLEIVEATHAFVDLYKVGKANYIKTPEPVDWEVYTHKMIRRLNELGKAHYVKKDLQKYLPEGYPNILRAKQHN